MSSSTSSNGDSLSDMQASRDRSSSEPVPEKPAFASTRRLIIIAFWAVVVAFGLPHWIWTTSIHRSNLPLESMNNWADGKACQLHYPLYIELIRGDTNTQDAKQLATQIEDLLNAQNALPLYTFHVSADPSNLSTSHENPPSIRRHDALTPESRESALTVIIQADNKATSTQASLRTWLPILDIHHNPGRGVDSVTLAPFIASEIRNIFDSEKEATSYLLNGSPYATHGIGHISPDSKAALDAKSTRAFKYASTYHLTFSLFTSSASPSAWEIEKAYGEYISPLLSRLSTISQFTIDTQVQLFASFSPSIAGPQYDSSTREWKLQRSDLSGFINAAEWPLNPGIGSGPTINFVLFVPAKDQSPLVLAETGGSSWVIPQWGGVQILNPTGKQADVLTSDDLRPVMLTFADQLNSLLGVLQTPSSLSLRISSLARERATSLVLSASSTLGALARLTLKLTSIAIPDSVAKSVDETINRLDEACHDIQAGRYRGALKNARIAESEAEQAFFEPSMVGQVYFPDEHKVAVYVPLLGPMAVPLVMAAIKEIRNLKSKKHKTA